MKLSRKNITIVLIFSLLPLLLKAQEEKKNETVFDPVGYLSMGSRNCFSSFFSNGKAFVGTGAGGEFGLRIAKDFNSHWFADWIVSNVDNLAQRYDFHSGFSMMPEILSSRVGSKRLSMFPLAGICIDYTKFSITNGKNTTGGPTWLERYSFAVQAGVGVTLPVSDRLDVSLEAHYMLHIGTCLGIDLKGDEVRLLQMQPQQSLCLEGHYVLALSMDFKLFKLWQKKSS
jgi:hypothetical protein